MAFFVPPVINNHEKHIYIYIYIYLRLGDNIPLYKINSGFAGMVWEGGLT